MEGLTLPKTCLGKAAPVRALGHWTHGKLGRECERSPKGEEGKIGRAHV